MNFLSALHSSNRAIERSPLARRLQSQSLAQHPLSRCQGLLDSTLHFNHHPMRRLAALVVDQVAQPLLSVLSKAVLSKADHPVSLL